MAEDNDPGSAVDRTSIWQIRSAEGSLSASARVGGAGTDAHCVTTAVDCTPLWGNAAFGGDVVHERVPETGVDRLRALASKQVLTFDSTKGGSVVDVAEGTVVFNSGGSKPVQYIAKFGEGTLAKRSVRAAAVINGGVWSATATPGRLEFWIHGQEVNTQYDIDAPCVPTALQARDRWLYWSCGGDGPAGVFNRDSQVSKPAPKGDVLLGDGFTVHHDHTAKTLVLTDAVTGTSRVLATGVPVGGPALDRRVRWDLDETTGLVAWIDASEEIHVRSSDVAYPPAKWVAGGASTSFNSESSGTWDMLLSRPVTAWSLKFTDMFGKTLHTISGGATPGRIKVTWDGKTSSGRYLVNGPHRWTLTAVAHGESGTTTIRTLDSWFSLGVAAPRDYGSQGYADGTGDLFALRSEADGTQTLSTRYGNHHTGTFEKGTGAKGWPTGATFIPIHDMNGDECNDMLVRSADGKLRRYTPSCERYGAVAPEDPSTLISSGWGIYDTLVSSGDLTGDGRADLLTRETSSGKLYLHAQTSSGLFAPRKQVPGDFTGYKRIVGAGDLDNDGNADVVLHDKSNRLWRMNGSGSGAFAIPVKLADNWGSAYNALVGVGDLTADRRPDLIARDTAGNLWRIEGTDSGTFKAPAKMGTGWQTYTSIL
ncbi:FG-GAP-like repeat-containing protein [Streptomyces sp. NPDC099050]|uniref:FG-GAP-like repeat-containing protein n=1 Tax=Streptomyces sp. NPDC099050 TaxID=3366100 RepID=UPI0038104761